MKLFLSALFTLFTLFGFSQNPIWTIQNRINPKMGYFDSSLRVPVLPFLYAPYSNKDSIGRIWQFTGDNKFYGQFPGNVKKPFATEDSVLARPDSNFVKRIQNIDTVLTISAMQSYNGRANLIVVKDTLRGGLFMKKGVAIVDNGITFTGLSSFWTRVGINNESVNVLWYGAIPNDGINDNTAFSDAIATGRSVYVPDGTFLITTSQTLNDNQTIYGNGNTSVLQTTTANNIQIVNMGNYCTVRDLKFLGSGKGSTTPYVSVNGTQIAVRMLSKSRGLVSNCTFQNMGGAGFYCQTTANVSHEGTTVISCQADSCFNGFYSGTGGEYINYIACRAFKCDYGASFLGGNNKFNSGTLDNNQTGLRIISDRGNDAHGEVVGSTINHCYQYSISIDSTLNSFLIAYNMMYYGKINIKKVVNGVVFEGNDIASTDTIFVNSSTNVQFNNNRFISTLPQLMKNWNGTANTNPTTSDITMFNNRYINVVPYSQATHPQNQLLGGVNIYGNSTHWGNNTGILNTSFSTFQESDGTRVGYIGDAASFDNKMYIVSLNNRDMRFGGLASDGSMVPVTMNAVYATDNHYAFGDSLIDRSGYVPMFRVSGGAMRSDSLLVASNAPTARTHIVGTMRFQSGLPGLNKIWTDTTGNGTGAWKVPSGQTLDNVLSTGDSSARNIVFTDTSKLAWRSKTSDYANIQFFSTGDLNNTSNLVFTMGDNPYYPLQTLEGFIFRKDTNSTVGVGVKYDTIINANDAFVRFSKKDNLANPLLMVNRLTNRVGVNLPDPTSTLFVNGSIGFTRRTITATTTLDDMDHFVLCNNASPIVVNLPSAPAAVGREYTITKINPVTASITITPSGGAQINGTTTVVINSAYSSQTIFSDGANWWVR